MTVFCGDLLGPSLISTYREGEQMILPFNECRVDVAMIGNHDLDFGVFQLGDMLKQTTKKVQHHGATLSKGKIVGTKWVCSNLLNEDDDHVICNQKPYLVVEKCGRKIGFIGMIERQWVDTFKDIEVDLKYVNYKRTAQKYAEILRNEHQCDLVIALAHMRWHHDVKLAEQVPGVDMVLGGHDHFYRVQTVQKEGNPEQTVTVIKSGQDFQDFSVVKIRFDSDPLEKKSSLLVPG